MPHIQECVDPERPRTIDDLLADARDRVGSERLGHRPAASEAVVS